MRQGPLADLRRLEDGRPILAGVKKSRSLCGAFARSLPGYADYCALSKSSGLFDLAGAVATFTTPGPDFQ